MGARAAMWQRARVDLRRLAIRGALVVGAIVLAITAVAGLGYRAILYPAPREGLPPLPRDTELRTFTASDGATVRALDLRAADPSAPVLVHFHGNGETIGSTLPLASVLRARGLRVVLVEYRGYGVSRDAGSPSERGLYADAEAVLDALAREGVGRDRIVLWGTSLGTGVATEMAVRGRGRALVLVAPYTSIPRVAAGIVPILPALVIRDRYDSLAKAANVSVPTLVVHGDRDEVIPYAMGVELSRAIAGARLLTVEGGGHNDLYLRPQVLDAMVEHGIKP